MISTLRSFASLYRELGPRWTLFRLAYAFRLRTGLIRTQMPLGEWKDYKHLINGEARSSHLPLPISKEMPENVPWDKQKPIEEADRILSGEIKYFSNQFIQTGFPPNWHSVPGSVSAASLPVMSPVADGSDQYAAEDGGLSRGLSERLSNVAHKHWSQIPHDSSIDIKFIWEPNRFAFVYPLVRAYTASPDEKYPEAFWTLIEDWAQHNPPNTGPNWMDGQEIALRLMACVFGYHAFLNSPSTTPERKENFTLYIAAQAERIYKNIGYAISTHSNHTISEAFGLWMAGLLFPELKHAKKYLSFGKQLLEQEAAKQIFPDGSYAMYSLNYHRFILHIYLFAVRLGEFNNSPFSTQLFQSVARSIEFLSHFISPETGEMPVYGSNDGALVLPLNTCDFTDYRPLLQLGWYITKGIRLFEPGPWDEDIFWLCGESLNAKSAKDAKKEEREKNPGEPGGISYPDGGIYFLRNTDSRAFIRCTDFISRPSHADQLHVGLWIHGQEIAVDAGTYLYSGKSPWRNGLAHTAVHNTVAVDRKDQMTMLSRFTWTNWSKGRVLKHGNDIWQGEHDGYKPVSHKRTVMPLEGDRWLVIDYLTANESHHYALHWLLKDGKYEIQKLDSRYGLWMKPSGDWLPDSKLNIQLGTPGGSGDFSIVRADANSTRGWRSRYYGHKEPAVSVMLEADAPQVTFWSFLGFEHDSVSLSGDILQINDTEINLKTMDD